jgi:hypothetical protein
MYHSITTKQHSILDYVFGLMLPALPRLLGAKTPARAVLRSVAAAATGQTVMTDFEGGKFGVLPMQAHLANDALVGFVLLGAAAMLKDESPLVRGGLAGLGLFSLGASLLTEPIPRGKGREHAQRTAQRLSEYNETLGTVAGADSLGFQNCCSADDNP